jgi:DNA-binding transcriptional LysR family regulator
MEFHQLRYFVAAAETGSMSKAAAREHVSQPALSRQVAQLERTLGVLLFERKKQRIHLTDAGRFLLPKARQLLCDADTTRQIVGERFGGVRRTLRLGFLGPFLDDLVVPAVREVKRLHADLTVSLFDLPPRAQLERLLQHELDAAIVSNLDPEHHAQLAVRVLSRHRYAVAVPTGHALAGRRTLPLAALRSERWVSLADSFFPGRSAFLRAACAEAGFEPEVTSEVDSVSTMLGAVATGDGVALVPRHSEKLPHEGSVFVRLEAPVPVSDLTFVTRRRDARPEIAALHDALRERARGLADG